MDKRLITVKIVYKDTKRLMIQVLPDAVCYYPGQTTPEKKRRISIHSTLTNFENFRAPNKIEVPKHTKHDNCTRIMQIEGEREADRKRIYIYIKQGES